MTFPLPDRRLLETALRWHGQTPSVAQFLQAEWGSLLAVLCGSGMGICFLLDGHMFGGGLMLGLAGMSLVFQVTQAFRLARFWPLLNRLVTKEDLAHIVKEAGGKYQPTQL